MAFLDQLREAIESGASAQELQVLIARNPQEWEAAVVDPEYQVLVQELTSEQKNSLEQAMVSAAFEGEERDEGIGTTLFGDPDSTVKQGMGPLLSQSATVEGAKVVLRQGLLNKLGQGVLNMVQKHPRATLAAAGAGGVIGYGKLFGESVSNVDATQTAQTQATLGPDFRSPAGATTGGGRKRARPSGSTARLPSTAPPGTSAAMGNVPSGFNVLVIDHSGDLTGTPGALAVISPNELGFLEGMKPGQQVNISSQMTLNPQLAEIGAALGLSDVTLTPGVSSKNNAVQVMFPETLEDINITSPFQIGIDKSVSKQPFYDPEQDAVMHGGTERQPGVRVPAGATLAPRIFNKYGNQTLLEWASVSARKHGVPLNILYGIVAHESGWNPNAIGDNGQSFGLAQIFLPAWGGKISRAQALNPVFALNWTAQKLRERFNQYGRWDAAIAAHNSPAAANFLVSSGKFQNKKSADYTLDVLTRSNNSGLADYIASADDTATEIASSGSGITVTPFVAPDPAATRQYVKDIYLNKLGRAPTEAELVEETNKINALAKSAYTQDVRRQRGQTSTEVDPAAQFEEGIEGYGEFDFHENVQQTQSFTNYAAQIARGLQQGL